MSKDYYKILGVEKNASQDEIKKAFRKQAQQYHPDKKTGDEAKFKEVNEAYSTLSDPQKRQQYDTFGSAGPGGAGFNPGAGGFGGQGGQGFGGFDFSQFTKQYQTQNGQAFEFDLGDIFGDFFGGGGGRRRQRKGANITIDVELSFRESIFGVEREITVNSQKLSITIPAGIENGQGLRVAGKGENGEAGPGDLIVRIWVKDHPTYRKEGLNLIIELEIKLTTALSGGIAEIEPLNPALDSKIEMKIPAGTSEGEILRIKGKGVPYETQGVFTGAPHAKRGDLLVVVHVIMPRKLSKQAAKLVEELKKEGI